MDSDLQRLIREHYPFPIAHAHKRIFALIDDDSQKLKCLIQTAEVIVQFLGLTALAQLSRDISAGQAPPQSAVAQQLRDNLRNPSFGKWQGITRTILKGYRDHRELLVIPELFDFYFKPSQGKKLQLQPVISQCIDPFIVLRNQFHHPGIPEALITSKITEGLKWLDIILAELQFLSQYPLAFVQDIKVRQQDQGARLFSHDLVQMQGCFSVFRHQRWDTDIDLQHERVILLASSAPSRSLTLDPFVTVADQLPVSGVLDIFLLNGTEARRARYLSVQFGQELPTDTAAWVQGPRHLEALSHFFDRLRHSPTASADIELDWQGDAAPPLIDSHTPHSTEEVYAAQYQGEHQATTHQNPYKFLDFFNPEDAELFFGRERDIAHLQRKFHNSRLLILHGESGTGKTSLIRAGLIPQLPPESYAPVYVRALQEPTRAIKEAIVRQLGVDQRHTNLPLAEFVGVATAHVSQTLVLILDQFEEFFLRFPLEVRTPFHHALGACVQAAHLDVHIVIALRDDYFSYLAEFQEAIPDLFTHEMRLNRLTQAQAFEATVGPLNYLGLSIDEFLVTDSILPQLDADGDGIEPPLLQIVCDALYQQAQDAGQTAIGAGAYEALGDVRGVLGKYLEQTLRQFGKQQPQARAVLKALVTAEGTKQATHLEELTARVQMMGVAAEAKTIEQNFLRKLVQARLVRVEDIDGTRRYELAHEFLVQTIGAWIAENERELTKVLEIIDRAYEAYQSTHLLLEPRALGLIASFETELVLPPEKQQFLDLSRRAVRKQRRGLWVRVAASLLVVALGVGGFFGWQLYQSYQQLQVEKTRADEQREQAEQAKEAADEQRDVAQQAELEADKQRHIAERRADELKRQLIQSYTEQGKRALTEGKPFLASIYLSAAYLKGENNPKFRKLLAQTIRSIEPHETFAGHQDQVNSAAYSLDGQRIVSASKDKSAKIWDTRTGELLITLKSKPIETTYEKTDWSTVAAATFSPDGQRVVTTNLGKTAKIWNAKSGQLLTTLHGHKRGVYAASFSPDGKRIVTTNQDKTAKVWDAYIGRLLVSLNGHTHRVKSAIFSPDGKRIVTASEDGTAKIWDAGAGHLVTSFSGHKGWVNFASFSPNGQRIVTAGLDKTAKVWDASSTQLPATLQGHTRWINSARYSPDGARIVTAGQDKTAKVWNASTGQLLATLNGHLSGVKLARYSPDGARIVTLEENHTAIIWDAGTGRQLSRLGSDQDEVLTASFTPDSQRIMTLGHETTRVWEAASGKQLGTLKSMDSIVATQRGPIGEVWSAAFSPDGQRVLTTNENRTANLWDATSGAFIASLIGHQNQVYGAAFSPNGERIVTASEDGTAKIWDTSRLEPITTLNGHTGAVFSGSFSPDGQRIVTASQDASAKIWDTVTGQPLLTLNGHTGMIYAAVFSPGGEQIVTASEDGTAKIWDAASGQELTTLNGHTFPVRAAAFSSDQQRIVTASADRTAKIWDASSGRELATLSGHTGGVTSAAFSPDGQRIITASADKLVKLWAANHGQKIGALHGHDDAVTFAAFSPDGQRVVTTSRDQTATVWSAASEQPTATLRGHRGWVVAAAFSPDGQQIVTVSHDKTAKVWEAHRGRELLTLSGHDDFLMSVAFSPDGQRILTQGLETVKVWEVATGRELTTISGHPSEIKEAVYSPDGQYVVTYGQQTAIIWEVSTGKRLHTLSGHWRKLLSVEFSPDGQRLVTASQDSTAKIWSVSSGRELVTLKIPNDPNWMVSATFSPDGQSILTRNGLGVIKVWDTSSGKERFTLGRNIGGVRSLSFSRDGQYITLRRHFEPLMIWNARTGQPVKDPDIYKIYSLVQPGESKLPFHNG